MGYDCGLRFPATVLATVLGYVFGDVFGRRLWATVSGDTEIVGFDCGLRLLATIVHDVLGYIFGLWCLVTVLGYGFGLRCLATVLGYDDAYVSNFLLTVHPGDPPFDRDNRLKRCVW